MNYNINLHRIDNMDTLTAVSASCTEVAVFESGPLVEEEMDKRGPEDGW